MWLAIISACLVVAVGALVYLTAGFHRFSAVKRLSERHKLLSWLLSIGAVAAVTALGCLINVYSAVIILIHLFIIWLICDLVSLIVSKIRGKKPVRNISGAAALVVTCVYMAIGWYTAHHVVMTDYTVTTDKNIGGRLKIAMFADSHLGITLDGEKFAEQMERINAESPDILLIPGDFVDDDSCRDDMVTACAALGQLHPRYGKFFTFGNHDKGYSDYRDFTTADLMAELEKNGVTVLQDETVDLGGIAIIGRQDTYEKRYSIADLAAEVPENSYKIVLDHQPNDYFGEADAGVDLVLSGHTHGGHLFPAGYIGLLIGANDFVYGQTRRSSTDFIVTSGISGWALPFKTGCKAEYVIVLVEN